jgi:hypothetical protein
VTTSGNSYSPILIRINPEARKVFDTGIRDHIDLILAIRQSAFARTDLFGSCLKESFFLALETNRQLLGCEDKLYILFYDNCSIYSSDQLWKRFTEKGVAVITCSLRTSNFFHVLDVLLFWQLKLAKKNIPINNANPAGTNPLIRIFKASEMVTASTTMRA